MNETEFDTSLAAHFAPRRHEPVRDWTDTRLNAFVDEGNAAREAAAMLRAAVEAAQERVDLEDDQTVWGRACLRAAAWLTPLRFWSIYLAVLAAAVAVGLWLT